MADPRKALQSKFDPRHRYANFGEIIINMRVGGFRCHTNTTVELSSPITAFTGINATGKSTLLQLVALAYKNEDNSHLYVGDFFFVDSLDPRPYADNASVEYKYWQEDQLTKSLTLSRGNGKWSGYKRLPVKHVYFAGCGLYLPKIEQSDFIVRTAGRLNIHCTNSEDARVIEWTSRILGQTYDEINTHVVVCADQSGRLVSVTRGETSYSEFHMGYGEARTQHLISVIEALPERSLVLLEEPETSLHPIAQRRFGEYLVDASNHKGHQIIITTHSDSLLSALPTESRVFLHRSENAIDVIVGLASDEILSLLTGGFQKVLHILVEDNFSKALLVEIIRRADPRFLVMIEIVSCKANADALGTTMRSLARTGLPVVAVRDGDSPGDPANNIFKLPGSLAPEKEVMADPKVKGYFTYMYGFGLDKFLDTCGEQDHHEWIRLISTQVSQDESALISEVARIYANNLTEEEVVGLVASLKDCPRG